MHELTFNNFSIFRMLENEAPAVHSPEHTVASIDDDNMETINFVEDPITQFEDEIEMISPHEIDVKKKRTSKGKKK